MDTKREEYRKLLWDYYNFLMDEGDGNAHEFTIEQFLEKKFATKNVGGCTCTDTEP